MTALLARLPVLCACVGAWTVLNGLLHDIFVLRLAWREHRPYDRDLLRLLLDGHILLTCGLVQLLAARGLAPGREWGFPLAGVACLSLLVYCALIFPFLKSFGTILLNAALAALLLIGWLQR